MLIHWIWGSHGEFALAWSDPSRPAEAAETVRFDVDRTIANRDEPFTVRVRRSSHRVVLDVSQDARTPGSPFRCRLGIDPYWISVWVGYPDARYRRVAMPGAVQVKIEGSPRWRVRFVEQAPAESSPPIRLRGRTR